MRARAWTAALLALLALAPALPAEPGPALVCDPACNLRASATRGPSNTAVLAADPEDAARLLLVAKDYDLPGAVPCLDRPVWPSAHASDDGGRTWRGALLPGYPGDAPAMPGLLLAPYACGREPSVAFGPGGRAQVVARGLRAEPALGGALVEGIWAAGTEDLGATWSLAHASTGTTPVTQEEPWVAVDPETGKAYLGWTLSGLAALASSQDGLVWGPPSLVPALSPPFPVPVHAGYGVQPVLGLPGPLGLGRSVHLVILDVLRIWTARSDDGGLTWAEVTYVDDVQPVSELDHFAPVIPAIAVATAAPEAGRVLIAWADKRFGAPDVILRWSDDGGATFAPPVRVTDDAGEGLQLRPGLLAAPDGTVHAAWYDERNAPGDGWFDVYSAASQDGAAWGPNLRVTDRTFDGSLAVDQDGFQALGDHVGLAWAPDGTLHLAWTDTREGRAEIYAARVAAAKP